MNGHWKCNHDKCEAVCAAYGHMHYMTLDQKSYDYPSDCAYVLFRAKTTQGIAAECIVSLDTLVSTTIPAELFGCAG